VPVALRLPGLEGTMSTGSVRRESHLSRPVPAGPLMVALLLWVATQAAGADGRLSLGGRDLLVRYWPEQQELALQVR